MTARREKQRQDMKAGSKSSAARGLRTVGNDGQPLTGCIDRIQHGKSTATCGPRFGEFAVRGSGAAHLTRVRGFRDLSGVAGQPEVRIGSSAVRWSRLGPRASVPTLRNSCSAVEGSDSTGAATRKSPSHMEFERYEVRPVGFIRSPLNEPADTPRAPTCDVRRAACARAPTCDVRRATC